jgi:hypothetical protein
MTPETNPDLTVAGFILPTDVAVEAVLRPAPLATGSAAASEPTTALTPEQVKQSDPSAMLLPDDVGAIIRAGAEPVVQTTAPEPSSGLSVSYTAPSEPGVAEQIESFVLPDEIAAEIKGGDQTSTAQAANWPGWMDRALKKDWLFLQTKADLLRDVKAGNHTIFQTRGLPTGRFGTEVLYRTGMVFTANSGDAAHAQSFIHFLGASSTYRAMVKKLDSHYAPKSRDIFILIGGHEEKGSKFRAGGSVNGDYIYIDAAHEKLLTYPPSPEIGLAAYVSHYAHETAHAYRNALGVGGTTLNTHLDDEVETRKLEIKVLDQSVKATSQAARKKAFTEQSAKTKAQGLTRLRAGMSVVSGDEVSYLEKFHIGAAHRAFATTWVANNSGLSFSAWRQNADQVPNEIAEADAKKLAPILADFKKLVDDNLPAPKPAKPPAGTGPTPTTNALAEEIKKIADGGLSLAALQAYPISTTVANEVALFALAMVLASRAVVHRLQGVSRLDVSETDAKRKTESNTIAQTHLGMTGAYDGL